MRPRVWLPKTLLIDDWKAFHRKSYRPKEAPMSDDTARIWTERIALTLIAVILAVTTYLQYVDSVGVFAVRAADRLEQQINAPAVSHTTSTGQSLGR